MPGPKLYRQLRGFGSRTDPKPLTRECPKCHAVAQERCKKMRGVPEGLTLYLESFHIERRR